MSSPTGAAHRRAMIARLSFPQDEARQPWLPLLLKAYAIIDTGVQEAVAAEELKGSRLACGKGCAACCRSHATIPVYPLELVGITWYAVEKIEGELREKLAARLANHRYGESCPMLVDEACAIHPLRPMACRQFNVFGRVCEEGEDAYYTRRAEVLTPIKAYADAAFETMLPFHGVQDAAKRRELVARGAVHGLVQVLQEYDWNKLAARMRAFDERRGAAT
jgi:Fe-S-cluster containining protein